MSGVCEIPLKNAPDEEVRQILSDAKFIAIVHNASADKARGAGLQVVMNKCMTMEHRALSRGEGE